MDGRPGPANVALLWCRCCPAGTQNDVTTGPVPSLIARMTLQVVYILEHLPGHLCHMHSTAPPGAAALTICRSWFRTAKTAAEMSNFGTRATLTYVLRMSATHALA
jgi:hypothetical protein